MTYDPQQSAREKTPFGAFQLKPTHLKTGTTHVPFTDERIDPSLMRAAAVTVCDRALDVDDARLLLSAIGFLEEVPR